VATILVGADAMKLKSRGERLGRRSSERHFREIIENRSWFAEQKIAVGFCVAVVVSKSSAEIRSSSKLSEQHQSIVFG